MYMLLLPIKNDKKARTKRCGPSCCFVVQSIQIESGTMKLLLVALAYHLETIFRWLYELLQIILDRYVQPTVPTSTTCLYILYLRNYN